MNRGDVERLLLAARCVIHHQDYVIIGSLSILGALETPPQSMTGSIDVDLYPRDDPGRAGEVALALGLGSHFEQEFGYYADAVSPALPTLPQDWESRLIPIAFASGVTAWCLDPDDAAISKYVRGEPRDRQWIQAGLAQGVLSIATIDYRLRELTTMDHAERVRAKIAIAEDRAWLAASPGIAP